jgi:zinc transport system substrate-binding protein
MTESRAPPDRAPARRRASRACSSQPICGVSDTAENGSDYQEVVGCAVVRAVIVLTLVSGLLFGAGCGSDESGLARRVVAAFYPIAYAAERVAPDANVENLTPAGAEPHDLELSARDVERVQEADAVLYFGEGFMPALEKAVEGNEHAVDLLAGQRLVKGAEGEETALDPHVWLAPLRYAAIVRRIADTLGQPASAGELVAELKRLDEQFRSGLARCKRHQIVTSHAAFGYLAHAYGLKQIPLTGLSPEAEPSAKAIERLVRQVEQGGATTVFFETLVSPKLAQTVAREAGAQTAVLDPIEGLTEDEIKNGADYFSVMRENLAALRKALDCK